MFLYTFKTKLWSDCRKEKWLVWKQLYSHFDRHVASWTYNYFSSRTKKVHRVVFSSLKYFNHSKRHFILDYHMKIIIILRVQSISLPNLTIRWQCHLRGVYRPTVLTEGPLSAAVSIVPGEAGWRPSTHAHPWRV